MYSDENDVYFESPTTSYAKIRKIGYGEQGDVYEVEDIQTHQHYALKISCCDHHCHENEVDTQVILSKICCKIREDWWLDTKGYIVMELVDQNLYDFLCTKKPYNCLNRIGKDLCDMLGFLTVKKVIHGDMALFNIGILFGKKYDETYDYHSIKLLDCGDSLPNCSKHLLDKQLDFLRLWVEIFSDHISRSSTSNLKCNDQNIRYLRMIITAYMTPEQINLIYKRVETLYDTTYELISDAYV